MNHLLFNKFFQIGKVKIGPTVVRFYHGSNQIGTIEIKPTSNNPILEDGYCVAINEDEVSFQPEIKRCLYLMGVDLCELKMYLLSLYYEYWKKETNPKKPDLSSCSWLEHLSSE
jgi:hypothetical protein